jgi:hypothetical protein
MRSIDFAQIKNRVSIESYCRSRGIGLSPHGNYLSGACPLQSEKLAKRHEYPREEKVRLRDVLF